jgi:Phosphotransferase enzyme family
MEIPYRDADRAYAQRLLGDDVPRAIREVVDAEECFFVSSSASLVLGLATRGGDRVALKVVPGERRSLEHMQAVASVQRALYDDAFPAPRPLAGPQRLGHGWAVVETWVEGEQRNLHEPVLRRTAARLLAAFVRRAPTVAGLPGGLASYVAGLGAVFPPPHNPRFDLSRSEGAWIDDVARDLLPRLPAIRSVVGHNDWSAKNMTWRGDRVAAVFDWADSVVHEAEEVIVGQAAMFFPATWDIPAEPRYASPEEAEAFVAEYEEAAGRRLDRAAVGAAQLYVLAYSARCEISDGEEGDFCALLRELAQVP